MSNIPFMPSDPTSPAYTYGISRQMYETHLLTKRMIRTERKPYPFTTEEGLRKIDFQNGSFEVDL